MSSIIKVDTIQNQSGANIISESSNTITVGASGDTITVPSGATASIAGTLSGSGTVDLSSATVTLNSSMKNTPAFSVYSSTGLASVTINTATKVPFDTEKFDTDNAFDSTTNYRFTVPSDKAGKYLIHLKLRVNSGTDVDGARASIYKNGSEVSISYGRNEFFETYEVTALLDLIVGDYIEGYFSVEFGTQGVNGGDGSGSQFFGYRIIE